MYYGQSTLHHDRKSLQQGLPSWSKSSLQATLEKSTIAGPLLDIVHSEVKTRTDYLISTLEHINVSMDESSNINGSRISNFSVHSRYDSLHYLSEDIRAKKMTAPASVQWLRNYLHTLSNGNLGCINHIASDTCSTIQSMWTEIEKFKDLR